MKVAVVGATGLVGQIMLKVLKERNFLISELFLVASERSIGKEIEFKGKKYTVIGLKQAIELAPDVAIFSAGPEHHLNGLRNLLRQELPLLTILLHGEWILIKNLLFLK